MDGIATMNKHPFRRIIGAQRWFFGLDLAFFAALSLSLYLLLLAVGFAPQMVPAFLFFADCFLFIRCQVDFPKVRGNIFPTKVK